MDVLYRTATGRGNSMQERKLAFKAFVQNIATLSAMTVLYTMMMSGDDDYEEQKGHITDYNFMLPGGALLPVPPDIGFLFKVIPERITDYILNESTDSPESTQRLKDGLLEGLVRMTVPPHSVPLIGAYIETTLNKSFFTGIPIVGRAQEQYEPKEQYTESTSEVAIAAGDALNMSPMKIDHIMNAIGGTTAGFALAAVDGLFGSDRVARDRLPGIGRFESPTVGGREIEEFYALRELVQRAESTAKKYTDEDRLEDYEAYVSQPEVAARMELSDTIKQIDKLISDVRKEKLIIRTDPNLTPDEKREQLDTISKELEAVLKDAGVRDMRKYAETGE
jgi:hypothetical protein